MKTFVSWSGGKDSSFAYFKAKQSKKINTVYLLNMVTDDGRHSRSHGISSRLLQIQAERIGLPIVQKNTTWDNYEDQFKSAIKSFKKENIKAGIFGDIDLQIHRDWVEKTCAAFKIKPILPLWHEKRETLIEKFIQAGFKAIIVAVNAKFLGKEWLGRVIDNNLVNDLRKLEKIDLAGEGGEYHTFVYDGPIFKKPVRFHTGKIFTNNNYWFLDLSPIEE